MTPDFEQLWRGIAPAIPLFEDLVQAYGFEFAERSSLGRYPRIRIERSAEVRSWIELWLEFDAAGRHHVRWDPSQSFELSCGAYVDVDDTGGRQWRYQTASAVWLGRADQFQTELPGQLASCLKEIEAWTHAKVQTNGVRIALPDLAAQSSVAPGGSPSVAPEAGAPSSAPRVNAGIGQTPEAGSGDPEKDGQ